MLVCGATGLKYGNVVTCWEVLLENRGGAGPVRVRRNSGHKSPPSNRGAGETDGVDSARDSDGHQS